MTVVLNNNYYGIEVVSSNNNLIYNNYLNNNYNLVTSGYNYLNSWNTTQTAGRNIVGGFGIGGNYWAYPNSTGFNQTCKDIDKDGFCDSVYWLDYLPLSSDIVINDTTPPTITINTPTPNGVYVVGTGTALDFSAVDLQSGVATISGNLTNETGVSQEVTDGSIIDTLGNYTFVITATDNSGNINISDPILFVVVVPGITVTAPITGDNWVRDTTQTIRWTYAGDLGSSATVELLEHGMVDQTWNNVPQANGVGSLEWAIPSQFEVSTYQVRVSAGGYSNTTGNFSIVKR